MQVRAVEKESGLRNLETRAERQGKKSVQDAPPKGGHWERKLRHAKGIYVPPGRML